MDKWASIQTSEVELPKQKLRERLDRRKNRMIEELADIENALKFMDDHAEFEQFHNLLTKSGF